MIHFLCIGDGNIHVVIMFDPNSEVEVKEAKKLAGDMVNCALSMGGTCTGEHGIGVGKMDHLVEVSLE
jgi:D-lactate dehydrogenase (cytochrome)